MIPPSALRIVAVSALSFAGIWAWTRFTQREPIRPGVSVPLAEMRPGEATKPDEASISPRRLAEHQADAGARAPAAREEVLSQMHEASVSYDAAQLPTIRPYLEDPDPEIRAAACEAMLVLGDASASPMLREAAARTHSPEEVAMFQNAAAYLELPPGKFEKVGRASARPASAHRGKSPESR